MPETFNVLDLRVNHAGIIDFDKFYSEVYGWFLRRGFLVQETLHKFKPPEMEWRMNGTRRDSGYRKTEISFIFRSWDIKEIVVKSGGKEKKMWDIKIKFEMLAKMHLDYENHFSTPFLQSLHRFLLKFILFYKFIIIEQDKVYYELIEFQRFVREQLDQTLPRGAKR